MAYIGFGYLFSGSLANMEPIYIADVWLSQIWDFFFFGCNYGTDLIFVSLFLNFKLEMEKSVVTSLLNAVNIYK